jgi:hypothetical protein
MAMGPLVVIKLLNSVQPAQNLAELIVSLPYPQSAQLDLIRTQVLDGAYVSDQPLKVKNIGGEKKIENKTPGSIPLHLAYLLL